MHAQTQVKVGMVCISLMWDRHVPMAVLTANATTGNVLVYPDSLVAQVNLGDAFLSDLGLSGTCFPQLIQNVKPLDALDSVATPRIAALPLLSLEYTKNPLDNSDIHGRLHVKMQQRQIVVHLPFIKNFIEFFQTPPDMDFRG